MGEGIKLPVLNGLGRTNRIDNWWSQPMAMGIALTAALVYTFWRLFLYAAAISKSARSRRRPLARRERRRPCRGGGRSAAG